MKGIDNATTATTSITNSTAGSTAFATSATGTGYGIEATSAVGAGLFAWSVAEPDFWDVGDGAYTGIYGWSPSTNSPNTAGVGVWGDSDDFGVYGSGGVGVYGVGWNGVVGVSQSCCCGCRCGGRHRIESGPRCLRQGSLQPLRPYDRAPRRSTRTVSLAGVTANSHVFAMVHYNRRPAGTCGRSCPHAGKLQDLPQRQGCRPTDAVAWFVIN